MQDNLQRNVNRIMFAGTKSGDGKTTVTCAVLACLKDMGIRVNAFKCGPDYIDPMFHSRVLQIPTRNLDSFMMGRDNVKRLLLRNAGSVDLTVIEGAMGYYDGIGLSDSGSAFQVADYTDTPVIIVVNAKGQGRSVLATIQGFINFKKESRVVGVIFNQLSPKLYTQIAHECEAMGVTPLGNFPYVKSAEFESRHLGLITAGEIQDFSEKIELLKNTAKQHLDIDKIIELANVDITENYVNYKGVNSLTADNISRVRIALARDEAFCFYYEDNLDYLREKGCEIVEFSPLRDERLPDNIGGLILGGGYPELYAKSLSENKSMRISIKKAIEMGLPVHAECGGFMYLHDSIKAPAGPAYEMVGAIEGTCEFTGKLQHFGYVTMTALRDGIFCNEGDVIRAHEFHRYISTSEENGFNIVNKDETYVGYLFKGNMAAGFPHIHYYSNLNFADKFIEGCRAYV